MSCICAGPRPSELHQKTNVKCTRLRIKKSYPVVSHDTPDVLGSADDGSDTWFRIALIIFIMLKVDDAVVVGALELLLMAADVDCGCQIKKKKE